MTASSVAGRMWRSFLGGRRAYRPRPAGRGRDGYTVWQRFWASFTGLNLPPGPFVALSAPDAPTAHSNRRVQPEFRPDPPSGPLVPGRLPPGWFALPAFPQAGGLLAAGSDSVVVQESSPDGGATFLVRASGSGHTEYTLELVLRNADVGSPLVGAVRYVTADGGEQVLLVPVVQGRFGPPASLVRLLGFTARSAAGWAALAPVPIASLAFLTARDDGTVAASVRAAANESTRDAWRQVRDLVADDLSRVIVGELA